MRRLAPQIRQHGRQFGRYQSAPVTGRSLHITAPLSYNWRWPAEIGGGWNEQPEIREDLPLRLRHFKQEGRITPGCKPAGRQRFTSKDHQKGVGAMPVGVLKSDAWVLQTSETFHQQGARAAHEGRFQDARGFFAQSIDYHGNHSKTYLQWARMEHKLGNSSRARELLEEAVAKNARNPFLLQAFGVLEWSATEFDAARARFRQALVVKPRDAVTYQSWGMLEHELGNLEAAKVIFHKGFKNSQRKHRAGLLHAWGVLEQGRGELQKARVLFLKSIQTEVRNGYPYCSWAILEKKADNIARARELFLRGVRADP
jgi:Tfp pilus assembly protein PilF